MLNFLSNSVKYNKPGGTIETCIEEISSDGTTAVYEFRITDTGIGMSEEFVKNKLFMHLIRKRMVRGHSTGELILACPL